MTEGVGRSGPARLSLSLGRGVNSELGCRPDLPGFPWEDIRGDWGVAEEEEEAQGAIYSAGKEERWEKDWERREGGKQQEEQGRLRGDDGSCFCVGSMRGGGWRGGRRVPDSPLSLAVREAPAKQSSTYWFLVGKVHAEVSRALFWKAAGESRENFWVYTIFYQ